MRIKTREDRRNRIKLRLRKRLAGDQERPRLTVYRSLSHIYVQVIDDMTGRTVAAAATTEPTVKSGLTGKTRGNNKAGAEPISSTPAELAAMIREGVPKYAAVVKAAGVKPE